MPPPTRPELEPNRVYRTKQFARWSKNPARLVHRLVQEGQLHELAHGLYYAPTKSRFGMVPPSQDALLRAFLETDDYVVTGPPAWNALGLGATAMFALTLVYNKKRSGEFALGGQKFLLRRVAYPARPTAEWLAIDLIENQAMAGVGPDAIAAALTKAVAEGRFDPRVLTAMAEAFGTKATQVFVRACLGSAKEAS